MLSTIITLSSKSVVLRCGKPHMATLWWGGSLPRTAGAVLTEGRVANRAQPLPHVAENNPRQRLSCVCICVFGTSGPEPAQTELAQINNGGGSPIQFEISLRAIAIRFIDCNQSKLQIESISQNHDISNIKYSQKRREVILPAQSKPEST